MKEDINDDIKRLEKRIKDTEDYETNQVWLTADVHALINLIKGYKELEEEHQKRIMLALNKELVIVNSKMYTIDKELYNDLLNDTVNNYIPKSKVREKIKEYSKLQEEMTNKNHQANNINDCYKYGDNAQKAYYKKEALQELLQEGDDK